MPGPLQLRNRCSIPIQRTRAAARLGLIALILAASCLSTCSRYRNPQSTFDHARQTYRRGDIAAAGDEAEQGYKDFHAISNDWAWQFIILRARVLYRRGNGSAALALLMSAPGAPPSVELAVQRIR